MGGQGGQLPTQVMADQLTLSQAEGALAHPALGCFLRHCNREFCSREGVIQK